MYINIKGFEELFKSSEEAYFSSYYDDYDLICSSLTCESLLQKIKELIPEEFI